MLLDNKKTKSDEQNWSIVLNPIRNEIDKKRVAQKISEVFSLSAEEALDLVSNTPIILLDNLSRLIAAQIKDYFQSTGAEMILTNDTFLKRKCYRTVWPEPPSLSFLHDWQAPDSPSEHRELEPDEAVNELRSMSRHPMESDDAGPQSAEDRARDLEKFEEALDEEAERAEDDDELEEPEEEQTPSRDSSFTLFSEERSGLVNEIERWREECISLREDSRRLREELERMKRMAAEAALKPDLEAALQERNKEIKELRVLLSSSEEKYEVLKEEYRESRSLFEEKLSLSARENEQWKIKINELTDEIHGLHQDKQRLVQGASEKEADLLALREEQARVQQGLEEKFSGMNRQIEEWKDRAIQMEEDLEELGKTKEAFERTVNDQMRQVTHWREKYEALNQRIEAMQSSLEQEKNVRVKAEERQKDLEKNQLRLIQEIEQKSDELRQWGVRFQDSEHALAELRGSYESQQKIIQDNLKQIELRDRELDSMRKQLRDVNALMEQRDAIQRKNQLTAMLAEKEVHLKSLVKEQQKIESEIREREESMRKVLEQQETVERDIVEAKQAQRHLLEQAKRERPLAGRVRIHKSDSDSGQPSSDPPEME